MRDIWDVIAAGIVGAVLLWFIESGGYAAFDAWIGRLFFS